MSPTETGSEARLTVGRWANTYLVPADHPRPEAVRDRLDQDLPSRLTTSFSQALERLLDPADPSVWRIRRLDLSFAIPLAGPGEDVLARAGAARLATELASVFFKGEVDGLVLHFPNRAAYLARFSLDLARGCAWGKWYYEEFESLRMLPASAAIRELLVREPEHTAAVVDCLAVSRRFPEILAELSETDAEKIYAACFFSEAVEGSLPKGWAESLATLWLELPLRERVSLTEAQHRQALLLFARWCERHPETRPGPALKSALDGFLSLRRILFACAPTGVMARILESVATREMTAAISLAQQVGIRLPSPGLTFLAHLVGAQPEGAKQIVEQFKAETNLNRLPEDGAPLGLTIVSPFGGIFLLGPSFLEAGIDRIAALMVRQGEQAEDHASLIRHLVAVKCLGRARAAQSASDPALRLFSGWKQADFISALEELGTHPVDFDAAQCAPVDQLAGANRCEGPSEQELRSLSLSGLWPETALASQLDLTGTILALAVLRHFARRLLGFQSSSPEHLYLNFLSGPSTIRCTPTKVEVELPRAPLALILRMSGISGQTYILPWLEPKEVCLPHSME